MPLQPFPTDKLITLHRHTAHTRHIVIISKIGQNNRYDNLFFRQQYQFDNNFVQMRTHITATKLRILYYNTFTSHTRLALFGNRIICTYRAVRFVLIIDIRNK